MFVGYTTFGYSFSQGLHDGWYYVGLTLDKWH